MDILLVGPNGSGLPLLSSYYSPPVGVLRLAAFLRKRGHNAEWFDPNLHMISAKGKTLEERLRERQWDIVGFSLLDVTLLNDFAGMHLARRICPKARIIAGGIEAQFNYQAVLDKTPCSVVVLGEGEIPMLMLANGDPVHEIPGIVFKSDAKPLRQEEFDEATSAIAWEEINYEDYWDFYVEKKRADQSDGLNQWMADKEIHTARIFARNRCPVGCTFCSSTNQLTWGSGGKVPVVSVSNDVLIETIQRIKAGHPRIQTIYLTDDDFCINRRAVIDFCKKVIDHGHTDLTYIAFARSMDVDDELLSWLKKANFRTLNIGIESFSDRVLDEMGKRCDAQVNHRALEMAKRHDVNVYMNMILITPLSSLEDIEISLIEGRRYAEDSFYKVGINYGVKPFKGSEMAERHVNFLSEVHYLEDKRTPIRRDEMIWAEDPLVRQVQERYHHGITDEVRRCAAEQGMVMETYTRLPWITLAKFDFMQRLIDEVRAENGIYVEKRQPEQRPLRAVK